MSMVRFMKMMCPASVCSAGMMSIILKNYIVGGVLLLVGIMLIIIFSKELVEVVDLADIDLNG